MSDEFDRRDWAEDLNAGIRNRDTWFRGLKTLVLFLFLAVARFALIVTAVYQFCFCLVRNRPSEFAMPVGPWLALYVEKTILFITWNSDRAPFPFAPLREVMEQQSDYQYEEPAFQAEDETFDDEEEPYRHEPASPPTARDEMADDEPDTSGETDEETGKDDGEQSSQPPRPDA